MRDTSLVAAMDYVRLHGNALQLARMRAVFGGTPPDEEALKLWKVGRNPDSGWGDITDPSGSGNPHLRPSSLMPTLLALRYAWELKLGVTGEVRGAILWITRHQYHPDGWIADSTSLPTTSLDEIHPDFTGDASRAFTTAAALYALDLWGLPAFVPTREQAYAWLLRIGSWQEHWSKTAYLAASAMLRREGLESRSAAALLAELRRRLDEQPDEFTVRDLADLIMALADARWPISRSPASEALTLLSHRQGPDGAFVDPQGREDAVEATITSLRALRPTGALAAF